MAINHINTSCGSLILCTSTNRYLFLLRDDGRYPNTWGLVGGKVEKNESVLQGLVREIKEELGGEIKGAKILPIEQYTSDNGKFIYHTFLIKVDEEFIPTLNNEHKGYCWVPLENYPKPLHPGVYRTIKIGANQDKLRTQEKLNLKTQ